VESAPDPSRRSDLVKEAAQFVRYGIVGVLLMFAYLGLALLLVTVFGLAPIWASPLSFVLCVPLAYLGQSIVVFRARWGDRAQQTRFLATTIMGFIIASGVAPALALFAEVPLYVNFLVVCILVPLTNFVVFRFWVFRARWR
jgi:putative flippase GtrA